MTDISKIKERDLFLFEHVEDKIITDIAKSLLEIDNSDKKIAAAAQLVNKGFVYKPEPINLYINSYGGVMYDAMAIIDIIQSITTPVHTIATGKAMSAGALVLMSGDRRSCYKNTFIMVHQSWAGIRGKHTDIVEVLEHFKTVEKMYREHILKHTKISKSKLKDIYEKKQDWYIDAKEALELGIVDEIL